MKRIAVVGCPGAGKTTFVRKLAEKTKLPVVHLDYYYHQKKYDFYNNSDAWIKKVNELIQRDMWIMDGNYKSTFDSRFKRADTIIFFDFPRRTSLYGALKRRMQYRKKFREDMPSDWKEKADLTFLKYVWSFNKNSRHKVTEALEKNKDKTMVVFKNRKQVKKYLDGPL